MAPSTALRVTPGQGTVGQNSSAGSVSWSCFTSAGTAGTFGPAGCSSARLTTSRFLPSVASGIVAPGVPSNLTGTVSGSVVTLNWSAPVGGDAPTSYLVQAGSSASLNDIASFDTGSAATSLAVFNVPPGTYFVRIRAVNSAGTSGPSNEVQLVVGGGAPCGAPSAPTGLAAAVTGSTVVLIWTAPSGCAATSYTIQAGSTPGASNLANFSTGSTATAYTATGVANGKYYVRVVAVNAGGQSSASAEITVTVGVPTPTPTPTPSSVVASFQLFDPATQSGATTECRIASLTSPPSPTNCVLRSTSFTLGPTTILYYAWNVQYTFNGVVKTIVGDTPSIQFSETCGNPSSTADGVAQPVQVTLTVTDTAGVTATATSGSGSQPALRLRLFTCGV